MGEGAEGAAGAAALFGLAGAARSGCFAGAALLGLVGGAGSGFFGGLLLSAGRWRPPAPLAPDPFSLGSTASAGLLRSARREEAAAPALFEAAPSAPSLSVSSAAPASSPVRASLVARSISSYLFLSSGTSLARRPSALATTDQARLFSTCS
uniref:Uncharacterized protein n=1 Tax=Emiliania huxleyi (strain CCMP1516) TaxID=280463 RepID=A0A0D3I1Z4_EMIH1